jgi:hypothetical protein
MKTKTETGLSSLIKEHAELVRHCKWAEKEYLELKNKQYSLHKAEAWSSWSHDEPTSESSFDAHYSRKWLDDERARAKERFIALQIKIKQKKELIKLVQRKLSSQNEKNIHTKRIR